MPKQKNEKLKDSILLEEEIEDVDLPDYDEEEEIYLKNVRKRLEFARDERDQNHEEFDGLTYLQYWWANERWGNTYIRSVLNKKDVQFQSGTLRTKLLANLSSLVALNLKADITAFTENDIPITGLGQGIEDIVDKTNEVEHDEEAKQLRQYEMLKHGYVFVEDIWDESYEVKKKLTKGDVGDIKAKWTSKKVKRIGMPKRTIISGLNVYLGDMSIYDVVNQPFIFTLERKTWEEAKQIYGDFARWKNIPQKSQQKMVDTNWRLYPSADDKKVEIVKYQDKENNEFQVFINSVPMLPIGFPLTEVTGDGEYTIVQQNLEPIRHNFAYGKSFVFKNKNIIAVLDMMMQLAVKKTQKSYLPPYLNLSQRVISKGVFEPGIITRGIKPGEIQPVHEKEVQGVTSSEFSMIQEIIQHIDRNTVSQTTTGSKEKGQVTATQIIELQRQARVMMGLNILSASLLEKKLTIKRMNIILRHWFDPVDKILNAARDAIKNKYRIVSRERSIDGDGPGIRLTIPTDKALPSSQEVRGIEENFKKTAGIPVKMIFLNPDEIKQAKLIWLVTVNPKEKRSSELSKMMFGGMVTDAINIGLRLNPDYIEERFAQVWDEDPNKMFIKAPPMPQGGVQQQETGSAPSKTISPQVKPPRAAVVK